MEIRRLTPTDALAFQTLRLAGLRESPTAFASTYEDEKDIPLSSIEDRLSFKPDSGLFGAFEHNELVGIVALSRSSNRVFAHKAVIWSMYVAPSARGKGVGRALLQAALDFTRSVPGIVQITLYVNASNTTAITLYQSAGFQIFGREPGGMFLEGQLHDELFMYFKHPFIRNDQD